MSQSDLGTLLILLSLSLVTSGPQLFFPCFLQIRGDKKGSFHCNQYSFGLENDLTLYRKNESPER